MPVGISNQTNSCCALSGNNSFRSGQLFATDQHLYVEDTELFHHQDTSKQSFLRRATNDVRRDLLRKGFTGKYLDERTQATIQVKIFAEGGDLVLPQPTILVEEGGLSNGSRRYNTLNPISILDGASFTTAAVAIDFGEPFNDVFNLSLEIPDQPFARIEIICVENEGCDHQLTLAATYRALELVYQNYMRDGGDCYDEKRKLYRQLYKEEIERSVAVGIYQDDDKDGIIEKVWSPLDRFIRG